LHYFCPGELLPGTNIIGSCSIILTPSHTTNRARLKLGESGLRQAVWNVMEFWLHIGVDGFRMGKNPSLPLTASLDSSGLTDLAVSFQTSST
jgi:hypothetical protein